MNSKQLELKILMLQRRIERLEKLILPNEQQKKEAMRIDYLKRQHARREMWREGNHAG